MGVRHALFPGGTRLDALAFAGGVLPDATLRGMRMFRSHGGTVLTVTGRDLRVRPLRPVRTLPAGSGAPDVVLTRLQFSLSRVDTLATGTAPAFGRPLAPRYGSDLLPLRLLSLLQRGDVFLHAASLRRFDELCQVRSLPAAALPLRALSE